MNAHIPDVLETISQLAADDVYTSPKVANQMLDKLPEHVWTDQPEYRWLDPGAKSGIFLREVYRRLMVGLENHFPDAQLRREHILTRMLFAAPTTQLNGEIVRRTLYQTTDATGRNIVDEQVSDLLVHFDQASGNAPFVDTNHTLDRKGKACAICRAPVNLIRDNRENFAYSFIHHTYPLKEQSNMKFDVIVGNPPYQIGMEDSEGNKTANITPLYNLFVEKAIDLNPRYILMITPSRWFAGGKGLNAFRNRMISDRHLRHITDIPNAGEVFPTVEVKGGVSYFLWDREWNGDCEFATFKNGTIQNLEIRDLRRHGDIVLRDSVGIKIVDKVLASPYFVKPVSEMMSKRDPFGQKITSNYKQFKQKPFPNSVALIYNNKVGYINREQLERNHEWVDSWKVIIPKASDGAARESATVVGEPIALAPGSACTQSYLIAGVFGNKIETANFAHYLTTKFCRFLVLQQKNTQNMTSSMFSFVPMLDMKQKWEDSDLYDLFEITDEEKNYINLAVGERGWIDSLDSAVPETHRPGGRKFKVEDDPIGDDTEGD